MKGTRSVCSLITAIVASGLMAFSLAVLSDESHPTTSGQKAPKPAHTQPASVTSAININKADVQTLAQLNGVGEKRAQAIVAYRESVGGFKSVDDLLNVKGVGEKILSKNRALLSVN